MKFVKIILSSLNILSLFTLSATAQDAAAPPSFATCSACHQATGLGITGAFPPLAGSEWVAGPVENLIRIQLRGLKGEIEVKGVKYNSVMSPNSNMSDDQIAEVLTYVRNAWGNEGSAVTPDMVAALRLEVGKPMLTVADLKAPNAVEEAPTADPSKPVVLKSGKFVETMDVDSGLSIPWYAFLFIGICVVVAAISVVAKK